MKEKITFLTLCALLYAPCCFRSTRSSRTKVPRLGFLFGSSPSANSARHEAFRQGLRELGYVEGKNIVIDWRFAEEKLDRLPALAAELVRLKVDNHRHRWFVTHPCRQGSDDHDSHCDGAGC